MFVRLLARAAAGLGLCAALSASAAGSFSGMVVFGDSLSDSGNNAALLSQLPGGPYVVDVAGDHDFSRYPSTFGTYSNGPVWTQYLAESLGLALVPSVLGGNNYAFGGALTATDRPDLPPSLRSQLNSYLGAAGTVVDPNALYIVAGGGNDIREAVETGADAAAMNALVLQYATDMASLVYDLRQAGAQHVLVLNNPDFGLTPMARAFNAVVPATQLSMGMNMALAAALAGSGAQIFDTFSFMTGVVQAGAASGFVNLTNACAAVVNACDLDTALFWDGIHPTTLAHQKLAAAVLATAVPEPAVHAMLALGLVVLLLASRRRAAFQQR